MNSREKISWNGEYMGVTWEIQRFDGFMGRKHSWTFYLYLMIDRIPSENDPESFWLPARQDEKKRVHYDYFTHGILNSISWHGGMTWYSKESGHDGSPRSIMVGCDYQHSWDYERGEYDVETIKDDISEAIRSFRAMVPGYRYWCKWDGHLHPPSEVVIDGEGGYRCGCRAPVSA